MRDRLIALLKSPHKAEQLRKMGVPIGNYEGDCVESMIADFLLVNGVIVPPCKAGDTVYWYNFVGELTEAKVVRNGFYAKIKSGFEFDIRYDDIGKTVFLSREEAEAALKGDNK